MPAKKKVSKKKAVKKTSPKKVIKLDEPKPQLPLREETTKAFLKAKREYKAQQAEAFNKTRR